MEVVEFNPDFSNEQEQEQEKRKRNKKVKGNKKEKEQFEELRDILTELPKEMLSLAERDLILVRVDNEINSRREMLLKKREYLNKVSNQNQFLTQVTKDYHKYYNFIIEQKREQSRALEALHQYLENLIKTEQFTHNNLKDAKKDQSQIIREMTKIKKELDLLVPAEEKIN